MFYIILQYKSINGEHVLAYPLLSSVMTFGDLGWPSASSTPVGQVKVRIGDLRHLIMSSVKAQLAQLAQLDAAWEQKGAWCFLNQLQGLDMNLPILRPSKQCGCRSHLLSWLMNFHSVRLCHTPMTGKRHLPWGNGRWTGWHDWHDWHGWPTYIKCANRDPTDKAKYRQRNPVVCSKTGPRYSSYLRATVLGHSQKNRVAPGETSLGEVTCTCHVPANGNVCEFRVSDQTKNIHIHHSPSSRNLWTWDQIPGSWRSRNLADHVKVPECGHVSWRSVWLFPVQRQIQVDSTHSRLWQQYVSRQSSTGRTQPPMTRQWRRRVWRPILSHLPDRECFSNYDSGFCRKYVQIVTNMTKYIEKYMRRMSVNKCEWYLWAKEFLDWKHRHVFGERIETIYQIMSNPEVLLWHHFSSFTAHLLCPCSSTVVHCVPQPVSLVARLAHPRRLGSHPSQLWAAASHSDVNGDLRYCNYVTMMSQWCRWFQILQGILLVHSYFRSETCRK